mgnify:CR=1 FL=1
MGSAEKLVKEINDELPKGFKLSEEKILEVAKKLNTTKNDLFKKLLINDYIDMDRNIVLENTEQFFEEYPDFAIGLTSGKITNRNKTPEVKVKIRPAVYNELKTLWEAINQKYLLFYDKIDDDNYLKNELIKIFKSNVFTDVDAADTLTYTAFFVICQSTIVNIYLLFIFVDLFVWIC